MEHILHTKLQAEIDVRIRGIPKLKEQSGEGSNIACYRYGKKISVM
jgi:hypothetical protein